jgi:hypothetical protein
MGVLISRLSSVPIARSARISRLEDGGIERETPETPHQPADKRYGRPFTSDIRQHLLRRRKFPYDLQASRRAIVVGAASRGGANPMNRLLIELGFGYLAFVSNGVSENPITKAGADVAGV